MVPDIEYLKEGCRILGEDFGFAQANNAVGILGFGYGVILKDGAWSDTIGLVLLAKRGHPGFPYAGLEVTVRGRVEIIPCCTFLLDGYNYPQVPAEPVLGMPELEIGAPLSTRPGYAEGTWSCFVGNPARYALTAAHIFEAAGDNAPVYCGNRGLGTYRQVRQDVARVDLPPELRWQARSRTPDGLIIAGSTLPSLHHLNQQGLVYCPTRRRTERPLILAAGMTVHLLKTASGLRTQRDIIMTEGCTHPGDSGTALITRQGFAIGILSHGRKEFS
ncbi:hypothetical protein, partial [Archangium sp.]|uniref:hypothetical protein n=1 Tax=Archangium sp. TaxID=1872627 RepID=UPI002D5C92C2